MSRAPAAPLRDPTVASDPAVLRLDPAMGPEARYRALVEILPDVLITLFDRDLRILSLEGGAVARLPMAPDAVIGHHLDEFLPPERVAEVEPFYRAALNGETPSFDFDATNDVTWWVQVLPMVDADGHVTGGMAKWRDVSARKAAERALEEHALELERSNSELEQFAYIASHDLSEPLRMITGYLSLLERRYGNGLDADAKEFIGFAVDGATRMRALIEDLLAFSRAGRADAEPEEVALQPLVESIFQTLTATRDGEAATLLASDLPTIVGDPLQLGQLFQNLLGNALKFVRPGEAAVLEVRAESLPDGGWAFTVDDNGIGFDAAQAERIFGMFQRLHTRSEFEGTGVGLAIARKVVERHRGRIWAQPRPGGGARLRFDLPAGERPA